MIDYFLSNKLFNEYQYGFIKGRSVVLQFLKIIDDWLVNLENGNQIDVIYTDFEKAFDKVPHKRLLMKLTSYRVDEKLIAWIEAFLCNRMQQVKINGVLPWVKECSEWYSARNCFRALVVYYFHQ